MFVSVSNADGAIGASVWGHNGRAEGNLAFCPEVVMDRLGLNRRTPILLVAVASIVGSCTSGASAPNWTFSVAASAPVVSPSAATGQSATPATTSAPTDTSAPTASAPGGEPIGVPPTGVAIYISEWSVGIPTSMLTGQVNFAITNIGTMPHEMLVFRSDLPPSSYPVDSKGAIIADGPGITLVSRGDLISPGQTQTRVVDLTKPGKYLFVCNLPGHFKAGMFRVVVVTSPSQQQAFVPAALSEWHIAAPTTFKAGSVIVEAANFGTIQHELLVFRSDLLPSAYPLDKDGNIVEDGPGITLVSDGDNIDPGGTQTRTVDLTQPGSYLFVCNIPGHFKAGMFSVITVTP
jgi:uncharacterized cupredoxin-like copper-binding protein